MSVAMAMNTVRTTIHQVRRLRLVVSASILSLADSLATHQLVGVDLCASHVAHLGITVGHAGVGGQLHQSIVLLAQLHLG
jgi:hypothetical protein